MKIDSASEAIVTATVIGPAFYPPEVFAAIEDYHNPRLKRLRDEYFLEKVVAGEPNEFRRMLKLRHWVHSRWPIDNDQKEGGDAFAILEKAKTGVGFHCSHSLTVQHAVMVSMGYVVRDLGVDRNHEDLGRSIHYGVNEVWSNDYAKWVLLDAKYDIHFERAGVPLSALELHEAVRADGGQSIMKMEGPERRQALMDKADAPEGTVRSYWWTSYYLRPTPFTEPHWSGGSRLLVFDNEAFRNTTWYRAGDDGKLIKHWAYAAHAFIPTGNRHEIEWTPGVPDLRARQVSPDVIAVQLRSATPNFKSYLVRVNGGTWKALPGDQTRWILQPGVRSADPKSSRRRRPSRCRCGRIQVPEIIGNKGTGSSNPTLRQTNSGVDRSGPWREPESHVRHHQTRNQSNHKEKQNCTPLKIPSVGGVARSVVLVSLTPEPDGVSRSCKESFSLRLTPQDRLPSSTEEGMLGRGPAGVVAPTLRFGDSNGLSNHPGCSRRLLPAPPCPRRGAQSSSLGDAAPQHARFF